MTLWGLQPPKAPLVVPLLARNIVENMESPGVATELVLNDPGVKQSKLSKRNANFVA